MSQIKQADPHRLMFAAASGIAAFTILTGLFIATMLTHYQAIDLGYLLFALVRIAAISLVTAVVSALFAHKLLSLARAGLFGAFLGFMGGVFYVAAAT